MRVRYLGAAFAACLVWLVSMSAYAVPTVIGMPNGTKVLVNQWDSLPYVWPNSSTELWGRVYSCGGGCGTYTADWDFGDGTAALTGQAVASRNNVYTTHTYTKTGSYTVTLTVHDTNNGAATTTIKVDVVSVSAAVKKALTVQRALKYLYMHQTVGTVTPYSGGSCTSAYWNNNSDEYGDAATSFAVLAFQNFGHRAKNSVTTDIYADTVNNGLNYMENSLIYSGSQNSRSNGYVFVRSNRYYSNAINAMSFVSSQDQTRIASCAADATVKNQTYTWIVQKYVNLFADGRNDQYAWHYVPGEATGDGSSSPWVTLALHAAEDWGITGSPSISLASLLNGVQWWVNCNQGSDGSFFYSGCNTSGTGGSFALTAGGVAEMAYAGGGGNKANALARLGATYCSASNFGFFYGMYGAKKGLQMSGVTTLNTGSACTGTYAGYGGSSANWQTDYNNWLITNQLDGNGNTGASANTSTGGVYWTDTSYFNYPTFTAGVGALILSSGLTNSPPQADAGIAQQVSTGTNVSFDGSNSYHTDTSKLIVNYEWDTNFDGITFTPHAISSCALNDGTAWSGSSHCIKPTFNSLYGSAGAYAAALRVTDNSSPVLTGISSAIVTVKSLTLPVNPTHADIIAVNIAPVANPGGPYTVVQGGSLTLSGINSTDANSATANSACSPFTGMDRIVKYDWDLDGSGAYATHSGSNATLVIPNVTALIGNSVGQHTVGLRVTDTCGATAVQSATLATVTVANLQPICYVATVKTFAPATATFTQGFKLKIQNKGTAVATVVTAALTNKPAGMTLIANGVGSSTGGLTWSGATLQANSVNSVTSDQDFRYTFRSTAPDMSAMTWDISYTSGGVSGQLLSSVPRGTGLCAN